MTLYSKLCKSSLSFRFGRLEFESLHYIEISPSEPTCCGEKKMLMQCINKYMKVRVFSATVYERNKPLKKKFCTMFHGH
jgi:hypothetical protein